MTLPHLHDGQRRALAGSPVRRRVAGQDLCSSGFEERKAGASSNSMGRPLAGDKIACPTSLFIRLSYFLVFFSLIVGGQAGASLLKTRWNSAAFRPSYAIPPRFGLPEKPWLRESKPDNFPFSNPGKEAERSPLLSVPIILVAARIHWSRGWGRGRSRSPASPPQPRLEGHGKKSRSRKQVNPPKLKRGRADKPVIEDDRTRRKIGPRAV